MRQYFVLSLLGSDRTGLVDQVTDAIRRAAGNLEDSRMAVLGEEFAMMILCSTAAENAAKLDEELCAAAERLGLLFQSKPTNARKLGQKMVPLQVEVKGMDNEGIVNEVVHHLVEQGISVETLESQVVNAPYSGVPLFEMRMRVQAPASVSLASLRRHLQGVGDRLNVDVEVRSSAA
jgi:glycine cleavage system transcriptional repressor